MNVQHTLTFILLLDASVLIRAHGSMQQVYSVHLPFNTDGIFVLRFCFYI